MRFYTNDRCENETKYSAQVKGKLIASNVIIWVRSLIPTFPQIQFRVGAEGELHYCECAVVGIRSFLLLLQTVVLLAHLLNSNKQATGCCIECSCLHSLLNYTYIILFLCMLRWGFGGIKDDRRNLDKMRRRWISNLQKRAEVRLQYITL